MLRSKIAVLTSVVVCFSPLVLTVAAEDVKNPRPAPKATAPTGAADAKSIEGVVVRASSIAGMAVRSPSDKDLGKVEDVVIDMETGSVRYVAIGFGGFLGFGDKLFAVPFLALHVKHDENGKHPHFVLNVDKKTLEKARGFDKKEWPNFADPRFDEENDRYFVDVQVRKVTP